MLVASKLLIFLMPFIGSSNALWASIKQDCGVSLWSEWNQSPDGTSRTRTREVYRQPQNGGAPCPDLSETEINPWNPRLTAEEIAPVVSESLISSRTVTYDTNVRKRRQTPTTILPRDILFIVDMSGSIGSRHFEQVKGNIAKLVKAFCGDVGQGTRHNRVTVVSFSTSSRLNFRFSDYQTLEHVQSAIMAMPYDGQGTCLYKGLEQAVDVFRTDTGMRGDAYSVKEVVILTDGYWHCKPDPYVFDAVAKLSISSQAKNPNARPVAIYAFVIGNFNPQIQPKMEKLVTASIQNHLFVFINMNIFDETVKFITDAVANNQIACAPFEIK